MKRRTLGSTGLSVSILGFGAAPLGGVYGELPPGQAQRAVHAALDLGVNYFDTAPYYGHTRSESVLGDCLRGVPRDRYVLSTKVGRYGKHDFDFSAPRVLRSVDESLARLRCGHIDILVCHDIEFGSLDQVIEETLPALDRLRATGKIRHLAVSGLPLRIFSVVLERFPLDVVLSYCRYTLLDTSLSRLLPTLRERGVGVVNAAPLSMGLLADHPPQPWHPASPRVKEACAAAARWCAQRGIDIADAAQRFAAANPDIATTLVGLGSEAHVRANVASFERDAPDPAVVRAIREQLAPVLDSTWPSGRPENADGAGA